MTTNSDNKDNKDDSTFAQLESLIGNYGMGAFVRHDNAAQDGGNGFLRPDAVAAIMATGIPTDPDLNGSTNSQWYLIGTWGIHADKVWPSYTGTGIYSPISTTDSRPPIPTSRPISTPPSATIS